MNIKKILAGLLPIVGLSTLQADDESRMRNIENRLQSLECCQTPCYAFNPPARDFDPNQWGFYVQVAPIIWQPRVSGTQVAIESDTPELFTAGGTSKVLNPNFDWDWGFRLGLGFNSCHDAWDVLVQWTRWCTDGSRNRQVPAGGSLLPTRGVPFFLGDELAQSVSSKWEMDYNILDLENGKNFYVSNCLSIRPFAGLRTAWIDQEFNTRYDDLATLGTFPIPNNSHTVDQRDRFWGIGIRGGVEMRWDLICDVSLFSNYAGSLLYAYHSVKQVEDRGDEGQEVRILDISNFFHVGTAIFDAQIGLGYDMCFCCDQYHLGFDLGWEHHWHPGQNQFFNFVDDHMQGKFVLNQGDLGIQGYFLKVRFDF